jgi:hypothetical protein
MESVINCKNPSSNPLQEACSGISVKVVSKAACDPVIIPKAGHVMYNVENLPTRRKARPEILMRLSD